MNRFQRIRSARFDRLLQRTPGPTALYRRLIEIMKPWYDNYCFSTEALDEPSMYNSDMVLYFMNRYLLNMRIPNTMLDANIRTDYNKLRHLIRVDKTFGENASVVQEIVEKGAN